MNNRTDLGSLLAPDSKMELTASDICKIIRACRDNAVEAFECGNIKVSFRASPLVDESKPMAHQPMDKPIQDEIDKSHTEEQEFLLSETVLTREDELTHLVTEDPEKYEDLISSGDLVDAKTDDQRP